MPRQVRSGSTRSTPEAASSAAASANPGSMRKRSTRSARGASGMRAIALLGLLLSPAVVPLRINTALRPLCRKHASASHALVMQIRDQPNRDVVATKEQTAQKATASMAQAEATTRNATLTKATNSSLGGANEPTRRPRCCGEGLPTNLQRRELYSLPRRSGSLPRRSGPLLRGKL